MMIGEAAISKLNRRDISMNVGKRNLNIKGRIMSAKNVKKLVSFILIVVTVFQSVFVFADTNSFDTIDISEIIIHHEKIDHSVGLTEQIHEFGGSVFHFRRTQEYIYASQLTPLGHYNFAFRFVGDTSVLTGDITVDEMPGIINSRSFPEGSVYDNSIFLSSLVMGDLDKFATSVVEIEYEIIHLEPSLDDLDGFYFHLEQFKSEQISEHSFDELAIAPFSGPVIPQPTLRVFPNMNTLLREEFPGQGVQHNLAFGTQRRTDILNGNLITANGVVDENFVASQRVIMRWWANAANLTLAVAAVALGLKFETTKEVAAFVVSVTGLLVVVFGSWIDRHEVVLTRNRVVRVNGTGGSGTGIYFWSQQDIIWRSGSGPNGVRIDELWPSITQTMPDFNDIGGLLRTGIDNWFRFHHPWAF